MLSLSPQRLNQILSACDKDQLWGVLPVIEHDPDACVAWMGHLTRDLSSNFDLSDVLLSSMDQLGFLQQALVEENWLFLDRLRQAISSNASKEKPNAVQEFDGVVLYLLVKNNHPRSAYDHALEHVSPRVVEDYAHQNAVVENGTYVRWALERCPNFWEKPCSSQSPSNVAPSLAMAARLGEDVFHSAMNHLLSKPAPFKGVGSTRIHAIVGQAFLICVGWGETGWEGAARLAQFPLPNTEKGSAMRPGPLKNEHLHHLGRFLKWHGPLPGINEALKNSNIPAAHAPSFSFDPDFTLCLTRLHQSGVDLAALKSTGGNASFLHQIAAGPIKHRAQLLAWSLACAPHLLDEKDNQEQTLRELICTEESNEWSAEPEEVAQLHAFLLLTDEASLFTSTQASRLRSRL